MPISTPRFIQLALPVLAAALMLTAAACGGSDPAPTATPTQERPAADPTPTPAPATSAPATSAPATSAPATSAPTGAPASPAPTTAPSTGPRSTGDVDGVTFVVSDGSEATFTVEEQLANLTLPNDAVMRTTDLSGEVRLDGGDSLITLGLQGMTSDNTFRDGYVRNRLLANQQSATIAFGDLTPLPSGFLDGDEVQTEVTGTISINGIEAPLTFQVQARDDENVIFVLGRTTFTWADLSMPVPTARAVVSVEDTVRVEVLLSLEPQS